MSQAECELLLEKARNSLQAAKLLDEVERLIDQAGEILNFARQYFE